MGANFPAACSKPLDLGVFAQFFAGGHSVPRIAEERDELPTTLRLAFFVTADLNNLVLCSSLDLGLEVVDEATSLAPPFPFDSSFDAAAGFVASSTTLKLRRNAALA